MQPDDTVLQFWNDRAQHGAKAGSNDIIAKSLEVEAVSQFVRDGMRVLEVGCGNAITAVELARRYAVSITGIDFASEMVANAERYANDTKTLKGSLRFQVGDARTMDGLGSDYDLAYTERMLINLPDWDSQREVISNIGNLLRPGGTFVMCENSQDGLDKVNDFRAAVGLASIRPPWHNRYFRESELTECRFAHLKLERVIHFSSTYYLLSRVVNAAVAMNEGREPAYDSFINQLALRLPSIGEFGQGKIWLWRKLSAGEVGHE